MCPYIARMSQVKYRLEFCAEHKGNLKYSKSFNLKQNENETAFTKATSLPKI